MSRHALVPLLLVLASPASAQPYDGWYGGWRHMMFGGAMMILFWAALLLVLVLVVRWLARDHGGTSAQGPGGECRPSSLELLQARCARGEIERDEYLQRKRDLES